MENALQTSFLDESVCEQNIKEITPQKKKRKQVEINLDSSMMELNWLILPLAPIGRERDVGTIIVKWTDSQGALRGIKISMTDGYNMLTRFDIKVLASLQKLYSEQNRIIQYDFDAKEYIVPIEIKYTIAELSKLLKYKTCGGTITKRIQNSIRKLANCTITSLYAGGVYDVENKCYITGAEEKGFHIIEQYDMYRYSTMKEGAKRLKTSDIKEFNKVIINNFFYQNLKKGYFKIISFDMLIDLKSDVSQRLFTLLEGWYCDKKPFVYFNYKTLYERIPLNPVEENEPDMPVKEKNRSIKKACEELVKTGYLQGFIIVPKKGVYFIFDGELKDVDVNTIKSSYFGLDKYGELKDVVTAFLNAGITENEIDSYVTDKRLEYCKALLRLYDMRMRYDNFDKSPEGWLRSYLTNGYEVDNKYWNKK